MKIIFTILFFGYNFSLANDLTPINFRIEKRKGQFSTIMKTTMETKVTTDKFKICRPANYKAEDLPSTEPGCSLKKTIDTKTDLLYEAKCEVGGSSKIHFKWISENVLETVHDGINYKFEMKTTYDGPVCDKDAVRM